MKLRFILTLFALSTSLFSFAQDNYLDQFKNLKARSIGPAGMSGRVTSIDVVEKQPQNIVVGTASGGVWQSKDGGVQWSPIFDKQATQNIGAVKIQQSNPDVIWAGTGEGNPRNSQSSGGGLYKSINGGKTWKLMGLENTITIHRIIVHRDNPNIVWVGATGSAWGDNTERGVFKTKDGGKTWRKVLYVDQRTGCADLIVDPSNPNKLFASMWEYRREPWFFTSGGPGSGLYVSFDGGETWKKRNENHGLPKGEYGRIGLTLCHSKPNVVYALVESKKLGLYRSDDGGFSWKLQSDKNVGNRPFYYADIYVDPINENRIYNLWSYVSLSEDGGKTFKTILDYGKGIHPDHHSFWVHPNNPNYLIEGNDGGLNISRDRGNNWRFVENLPVGQFYHVNHDLDVPYNVYGGMQDNGSWIGPSRVLKAGGIRNNDFSELYFGDGFDVVPITDNSRYGYAMSQGGNVVKYDRLTGKNVNIKPVHPDGIKLRFNWNAAIAIDPFDSKSVYFGSQFVHYSNDMGNSWKIISPDLTTNDPEKQKQATSGGLTIDATQAENYTNILCIAPSPIEKQTIWVGTDDGNLQLTKDGGKTWSNVYSRLKGAPQGGWIPQTHVSKHNAGEAFVVINNYRKNDWGTYVYHTNDFGKKWNRLAHNGEVKGYALSFVQDPVVPELFFLGTENGLWISIDAGETWEQFKNGFPSVSTMDMKVHPVTNDLILGTFGRSIFIIDDISALRAYAKDQDILNDELRVFAAPKAYMFSTKSVDGVRFVGDAHFRGENKRNGAHFDVFTKAPDKKKKAHFIILNELGDTVRDYKTVLDTGINRMYWRYETNGVRYPSYQPKKKDDNKPGGMRVSPGKYTLTVVYEEFTSSTTIEVLQDPRLPDFNEDNYAACQSLLKEHYKTINTAKAGFNRLRDAQGVINLVNSMMINAEDSAKADIAKEGKALNDSIKSLMALYMTPKDFVGYDHVTVRLNDHLRNTTGYILNSEGAPSQMAKVAVEKSKSETEKLIKKINSFFENEWTAYQELVNKTDNEIFKSYQPLKIED
ncbi:MAG: hypothetical protein JXQ87_13175 [Bacteroidia bacterium]